MVLETFKLVLEPHQVAYYPGQLIAGALHVETSEDTSCRGVSVELKGKAFVYWSEGQNKTSYTAQERYCKQQTTFPVANDTLTRGTHSFPFSFTLPHEVPSSFEGEFGFIRYKVKAVASRSMAFDVKQEVYFTFIQPEPLETIRAAQEPLALETEETSTCCLCWTQGPVAIQIHAPARVGVVGGQITVGGSASNRGSSEVENLTIAFKQKIVFVTEVETKKTTRVVYDVDKGKVGRRQTIDWRDIRLPIPALVPSLKFCNIIKMNYVLQVKCSFGPCRAAKAESEFFLATPPVLSGGSGAVDNLGFCPPPSTSPDTWGQYSSSFSPSATPSPSTLSGPVVYKPCFFCSVKNERRLHKKKDYVPHYPCLTDGSSNTIPV